MKSFLHSVGNAFLTVLTIILIGYAWAFIEIKILLKSQPDLFGYAFYLYTENDMAPEFTENDVVVVKKGDTYSSGDIILYFDGEESTYKMHYVVSTNADTTVTKNAIDENTNEPISNDNVVGRAVGKVLFMGAIIQFFKQKVVLITLGVAGVVFLVISQYMEFKPKKKEQEETKEVDSELPEINDKKSRG